MKMAILLKYKIAIIMIPIAVLIILSSFAVVIQRITPGVLVVVATNPGEHIDIIDNATAESSDYEAGYPPSNVLDNSYMTYWVTTIHEGEHPRIKVTWRDGLPRLIGNVIITVGMGETRSDSQAFGDIEIHNAKLIFENDGQVVAEIFTENIKGNRYISNKAIFINPVVYADSVTLEIISAYSERPQNIVRIADIDFFGPCLYNAVYNHVRGFCEKIAYDNYFVNLYPFIYLTRGEFYGWQNSSLRDYLSAPDRASNFVNSKIFSSSLGVQRIKLQGVILIGDLWSEYYNNCLCLLT